MRTLDQQFDQLVLGRKWATHKGSDSRSNLKGAQDRVAFLARTVASYLLFTGWPYGLFRDRSSARNP
jgi:hypothetical protein